MFVQNIVVNFLKLYMLLIVYIPDKLKQEQKEQDTRQVYELHI